MGKYSSDSDSTESASVKSRRAKYSNRSKGRRSRSSSSESSRRKPRHRKRCKGRRSRSKERYSRSRRHGGRSRHTSSSNSSSEDSRGPSKSKIRRSPVSSSSTTNSCPPPPLLTKERSLSPAPSTAEQLRAKVQRAVQAARSADIMLRQRRGEVTEIISAPLSGMLDEINSSGFVQRTFSSSASAPKASLPDIPLPAVVDLAEEFVSTSRGETGIMNSFLLDDQEGRMDRWVKKLFTIRQKAIHGEPL